MERIQTQVLILSADVVFARMLTLELEMQRLSVCCATEYDGVHGAEVVLLDLDSALPPPTDAYRHMIGFTVHSASAEDETRRLCSLILRRPFEMHLLRGEVLSLLSGNFDTGFYKGQAEGERMEFREERGAYHVLLPSGRRVLLSPKEYAVFELLLANRGKPVSRAQISERIGESSANKADVYICYLRKKIETPERRVIRTVRGKGYCLI